MWSEAVSSRPRRAVGLAAAAVVAAGLVSAGAARPAAAQEGGEGFLFRAPVASVIVRGGWTNPAAGGDLFAFTREQLTVDRGDFGSTSFGADLALHVSPRVDLVLGGSFARSRAPSEFREWVDQDQAAIEQTTEFRRIPVTASARFYLTPRGRSVGRYAWVPARFAPYVGAGGGMTWYKFRQAGDFVDYETLDVFPDQLETNGRAATAHAMAGVDMTLTNHFGLTAEARYGVGRGPVGGDFQGFDRIDLSGATATVGLFVRF